MLLAALTSCGSSAPKLFGKKTPHEKYAEKLDDAGLEDTPEGRAWLAVSKTAIANPQSIELPYNLRGYFAPDKPRALGLQFAAKQGEQLTFTITKKSTRPIVLYADLFKKEGIGTSLILSADTASSVFHFDIDEPGPYVLRLQPELFRSGEYSLSVSVGPSLSFPVAGAKAKAGSFWGDSREGGKRSHEGIDIFAPKGTPAVAAADGVVTGIKDGGIGGKVVWLRLLNKNVTLYYAHLDKQLVQQGQQVKKGETLGFVGNTGNAKYTPAHLHFGVYTYAGPIDPLPYVNKTIKSAATIPEKKLTNYLRLTKTQNLEIAGLVKANTLLVPVGVTANGYLSELPDGKLLQLPFKSVQLTAETVKTNSELAGRSFNGKEQVNIL